jgi:hypothetical protein
VPNIENQNHPTLLGLEADHETVFSSQAEFVAHHKQISVAEAKRQLETISPDTWTRIEISKADVRRKEL